MGEYVQNQLTLLVFRTDIVRSTGTPYLRTMSKVR